MGANLNGKLGVVLALLCATAVFTFTHYHFKNLASSVLVVQRQVLQNSYQYHFQTFLNHMSHSIDTMANTTLDTIRITIDREKKVLDKLGKLQEMLSSTMSAIKLAAKHDKDLDSTIQNISASINQLQRNLQNQNKRQAAIETPNNQTPLPPQIPAERFHQLAYQFLKVAASQKSPIFLVEPALLQLFVTKNLRATPYRITSAVTFGILSPHHTQVKKMILPKMKQTNPKIGYAEVEQPLPVTAFNQDKKSQTTHYIFYTSRQVVLIVVFWKMKHNFTWTGSLNGDMDQIEALPGVVERSLPIFTKAARSFDIFQIHKVALLNIPKNPWQFLWEFEASEFVPCNYDFQKSFYRRFPGKDIKYRERLLKAMLSAKKTYNTLHRRLWIAEGTLLGWYRQCDIIHYTTDVDFGAWAREYKPADLKYLEQNKNGLSMLYKRGLPEDSLEFSLAGYNTKVDVFYFYEEKNYTWAGAQGASLKLKVKYKFPLIPKMCSTELQGFRFNVPCNARQLVKASYGKEWFVAKKQWTWYRSGSNIVKNGKWTDEQFKKAFRRY